MGALGGTILGKAGLGDLSGGDFLGSGGVEGSPDGSGLSDADIFFDFSSGLPGTGSGPATGSAMVARNGMTFEAVGGYTEEIVTFSEPGNLDKNGIWNDADIIRPDLADFDIKMTFVWQTGATSSTGRMGAGVFDVDASTDGLSPWLCCNRNERNFSRIRPGRVQLEDTNAVGNFTNAASAHTLTGAELTADGVTEHTQGFKVVGTTYTAYFDDVVQDSFELTAGERADLDTATRIGISWANATITVKTHRVRLLEYSAAGDLWI